MELFTELLINALENGKIEVTFPDLKLDPAEIVELQSYAALRKIKKILEDHDPECFKKIEKIVQTLELLGSGGGTRHDFG